MATSKTTKQSANTGSKTTKAKQPQTKKVVETIKTPTTTDAPEPIVVKEKKILNKDESVKIYMLKSVTVDGVGAFSFHIRYKVKKSDLQFLPQDSYRVIG